MEIFQGAKILLKYYRFLIIYKLCSKINYVDSRFAGGETGWNESSSLGCYQLQIPEFPWEEAPKFSDATDAYK